MARPMARLMAATLFSLLAGCAAPMPSPSAPPPVRAPHACLLPSQQRMLVAELFFGRGIHGGGRVSNAEWANFLATVITPNFPDGLTVFDGYGQSRNPATGIIGRSPRVKIVLIAVKRSPDLPSRFAAVIDGYKKRFRQRSVGIITRDACAAF
jgi:Protein of unknown function (DUF3574)